MLHAEPSVVSPEAPKPVTAVVEKQKERILLMPHVKNGQVLEVKTKNSIYIFRRHGENYIIVSAPEKANLPPGLGVKLKGLKSFSDGKEAMTIDVPSVGDSLVIVVPKEGPIYTSKINGFHLEK